MTRYRAAMQAAALTILACTALSAQRVTRRVFVNVTGGGAAAPEMTAADFAVIENGVKREVTRAARASGPMRIVLLVDSSTAVNQMLTHIRPALTTFLDTLPPEHEVAFVSTGGQLRIIVQPTTDRVRLKTEAERFSSGGGANSFVDSLLEADRRLLRPMTQWPVFVILTTDTGASRGDPRTDEYNRFVDDFLRRGGSAHGIVVKGTQASHINDIAINLIQNTGGIYDGVNQSTVLEERLKAIAGRLADDHRRMANAYEVDYTTDAKVQQPQIEISTARQGVTLRLSMRRRF
jgi:hypothetical protein